ncbi:hypothetical protein B0H14DRAFT_2610703 [Mycena olivaceomarginata]|nr:hypothetical protein B0H14DRAFT_2610703 [Mycena olivaceomarginata]
MAKISFIFGALLAFLLQPRMFHHMLDFWATQNWLQFMANLFAQESYSLGPSATLQQFTTELQVIANHVKNCSDAFNFSIITLASVIPSGQFSPKLTADDPATLNTLFHIHDPRPPQHVALRQGILRRRERESPDAHRSCVTSCVPDFGSVYGLEDAENPCGVGFAELIQLTTSRPQLGITGELRFINDKHLTYQKFALLSLPKFD